MVEFQSATRRFFRRSTLTAVGLTLMCGTYGSAFARHHHFAHVAHRGRSLHAHRAMQPVHIGGGYVPPFSVYAEDGNSGRVLYARDENALRHPASITKVMTLYLLFEQIEKGHISLDSRISVSEHAASQAPTKLGLRPGSTIRVEDAILSIVTKSANDMAVAVAERLGGDEETFARMMTRRAHALGMSRTNFVNASGLPDAMQLTTAHDLVILGRAIHDRYPRYFRFFSTPSFRYAGQFMPNHNHLMGQVDGMDGIKTGYTNASGFNLLSSVSRNGHWMVSVVLGGRTRLGRDRIMADLIESQIDHCSTTRTAPVIAENPTLEQVAEAVPVIQHEGEAAPQVEAVDDEAAEARPVVETQPPAEVQPAISEDATAQPIETAADDGAPQPPAAAPRHISIKTVPDRVASLEPMPRARPAFVSGVPRPPERDLTATGSIHPRGGIDGSTPHFSGGTTATPSGLRHSARRDRADPAEKAKPIKVASLESDLPSGRPAAARSGWMIQIGATDSLGKANDLLDRAKAESHGTLARAKSFTEKVEKGGATLYRARFAGLESNSAEAACKALKKAGLSCFATKS